MYGADVGLGTVGYMQGATGTSGENFIAWVEKCK